MKLVYPMRADGLFILKNNDYEQIAKEFLEKYDKRILAEAKALDIVDFAESLDLVIDDNVYITDDYSILGMIAFDEYVKECYDYAMRPKNIELGQGQVLIDARLNARMSYARKRFTIAHETGHWITQRTYHSPTNQRFEYRKPVVECRQENVERYGQSGKRDWIETQADKMGAALLMPQEPFSGVVETMIKHSGLCYDCLVVGESKERSREIITDVSEIFEVSKKAAQIRMRQLGFIKTQEEYDRTH